MLAVAFLLMLYSAGIPSGAQYDWQLVTARIEPAVTTIHAISGDHVSQRRIEPTRVRPGAALLHFATPLDVATLADGFEVCWLSGAHGLLHPVEFALGFEKQRVVVILPLAGWEIGKTYAIYVRRTVMNVDGEPVTDGEGAVFFPISNELERITNESKRKAPEKSAFNPFPGGRPWTLTYGRDGLAVKVLADEPLNTPVSFTYGPYGRITSRNDQPFTYDAAGRRVEDDRYTYIWDWRSRLYGVRIKPHWPDGQGGAVTSAYAGHTVRYEYDARGRLLWRRHLDEEGDLIELRGFVWEQHCLVGEVAFTDEARTRLRWRKTYIPGPQGMDDHAQMRVETFPTTSAEEPINKVYTFLRDELGSVIALVDRGTAFNQPPHVAARYLYTPYGEVRAIGGPAATQPVFPGGQSMLFHGLWTDQVTGLAYARARWYDPRSTHFLSEDPRGDIESPNLYAFVVGRPHAATDPLGLTSRSDIPDNLVYTWHLGWIDFTHAQDPGENLSLRNAWRKLKQARPGDQVTFDLVQSQGGPNSISHKAVWGSFRVTVPAAEHARANQLYYAFQTVATRFEEAQGEGIQSSQLATSFWGFLHGEKEKVASSFSTEDLVSNQLSFIATVEETTINDLLQQSGRIDEADEATFSLLVWDEYFKPESGGNTSWDEVALLDVDAVRQSGGPGQDLISKYLSRFGPPALPEFFLKYTPWSAGVEVLGLLEVGGEVENALQKVANGE